jgi:hypothetical protein
MRDNRTVDRRHRAVNRLGGVEPVETLKELSTRGLDAEIGVGKELALAIGNGSDGEAAESAWRAGGDRERRGGRVANEPRVGVPVGVAGEFDRGSRERLHPQAGDLLYGGTCADVFAFHPGFGNETITSFAATGTKHDVLLFDSSIFAD